MDPFAPSFKLRGTRREPTADQGATLYIPAGMSSRENTQHTALCTNCGKLHGGECLFCHNCSGIHKTSTACRPRKDRQPDHPRQLAQQTATPAEQVIMSQGDVLHHLEKHITTEPGLAQLEKLKQSTNALPGPSGSMSETDLLQLMTTRMTKGSLQELKQIVESGKNPFNINSYANAAIKLLDSAFTPKQLDGEYQQTPPARKRSQLPYDPFQQQQLDLDREWQELAQRQRELKEKERELMEEQSIIGEQQRIFNAKQRTLQMKHRGTAVKKSLNDAT